MSVVEYGDVHIANCANDMMCLDITQMLLDSVQTGYELANFHLAFIHMNLTVFVVQAFSQWTANVGCSTHQASVCCVKCVTAQMPNTWHDTSCTLVPTQYSEICFLVEDATSPVKSSAILNCMWRWDVYLPLWLHRMEMNSVDFKLTSCFVWGLILVSFDWWSSVTVTFSCCTVISGYSTVNLVLLSFSSFSSRHLKFASCSVWTHLSEYMCGFCQWQIKFRFCLLLIWLKWPQMQLYYSMGKKYKISTMSQFIPIFISNVL